MSVPRISVGVPLHASERFVDVISANIDAIGDPDAEILISDPTRLDGARAALEARHAGDSRVRFLEGTRDPGWRVHYNDVLDRATGRHFVWMPHDDDLPAGYVAGLTAALEEHPDALLAFGTIELIEPDGAPARVQYPPLPVRLGERPPVQEAVRLLRRWGLYLGTPFRGVFRRDLVVERQLWIRPVRGDLFEDACWTLAVAACGPLVYVPSCSLRKRSHASSTHAQWQMVPTHELGWITTTARYARGARLRGRDRRRLLAAVTAWALPRVVMHACGALARRVGVRGRRVPSTPRPMASAHRDQ